jgi:hypothetical protein
MGLPLQELNERLWNWIDNVYHRRELCNLETTPLIRWQRDIKQVRRVSLNIDLSRLFSNGHLNRAEGHHSADILPEHSHKNSPSLIAPNTQLGDAPVAGELKTYSNGPPQGPAPPACPVKDAEVPSLGSKPNRRPIDATTSSGTSRKWLV